MRTRRHVQDRPNRLISLAVAVGMAVPVALTGATSASADTTVSTRVDDTDPIGVAVAVSQLRFVDAGASGTTADHVVLSRDDDFADTLAGTPLTADGPLLYTPTARLDAETAGEVDRVLGSGGRVYVLGGTAAVSDAVVTELRDRGHQVTRLRGTDRIATSLAIATEVRRLYGGSEVLMARARGLEGSPGSGWADSVAGGARAADQRIAVLLTDTAGLDPRVDAWLDANRTVRTHLLGGTAALSSAVESAVPSPRRHRGPDRTGTAAAIAKNLWGASDTGARAFTIIDAAQDRGWAFGLAAAGLAADNDAPILTTIGRVTPETRRMVGVCGTPLVDLTIVGDGTLVSGAVREYLDDLDGQACGPDRTLERKAGLERFADCPELLDWYRTNALERVNEYGLGYWYGWTGGPEVLGEVRDGEPQAAPTAEADGSAGSGSDDVSGTNTQEVGVDEPDLLKTDGKVLAVVNDDRIDLVDMRGLEPRLATSIQFDDWGTTELLLTDGILTALRSNNFPVMFARPAVEGDFAPGQPQRVTTTVTRWDVTSPDTPVELSSFEMDGWYRSARMVDGVARIVVESGPHGLPFTFPQDGSEEERKRALEHNRQVVRESTLQNWLPSWTSSADSDGTLLVDCADVHEPPAWSGFDGITVVTYDTRAASTPGKAATVVATGQNVYASTERLLVTTGRWGWQFEDENLDSVASTELHAFDISAGSDIAYVGSGQVDGYVISQFALSEHDGDIRVAATKQPPWRGDEGQQSESFVAVLREQGDRLGEVGRVGGLGLGEQIQAVRYFGDLGVVVTFRQIDPLYLIDLTDGTAPRVTGELKDTGFSRYLHMVGEDLLMGVGVDADDDGRQLGAMIALYDISDRTRPTRVARLNVPDASSSVGFDHRAFLYWPTTADAFVPMSHHGKDWREDALVMRVDEAGRTMTRRGALSHATHIDGEQPWLGQVRRTFIVGGNVYSVSYAGMARHALTAPSATTAWTAWPERKDGSGGGEPIPVEGGTPGDETTSSGG